jgi:dipeptidyl-peptidase-4
LAHAYHDRVLGFERADVAAAYEAARAAGTYNSVERINGQGVKSKGREKAYAMVNPKEYFAETSEAFFSRNDFFPFDKAELAKADPRMTELLAKLWGVTP